MKKLLFTLLFIFCTISFGQNKKKAIEICTEEEIPRTETYHLLSTLETKGIVTASIQRPTRFSSVKIEKAIESIIRVVYMDLIGKAGLFFIAEIKTSIIRDIYSPNPATTDKIKFLILQYI